MLAQNRRGSERKPCWFKLLDDQGCALGHVGNISAGGVFLDTAVDWCPATTFGFWQLADPPATLDIPFEVIWRGPGADKGRGAAGLRFRDLPGKTRRYLQDYLSTSRPNELLKTFQRDGLITEENLKPIGDVSAIYHILRTAQSGGSVLNLFWSNGRVSVSSVIRDLNAHEMLLEVRDCSSSTIKAFDSVFAQLQVEDRCFYLEIVVKNLDRCQATTTVPDVLFVGERRVESRQMATDDLVFSAGAPNNLELIAPVRDLNSSGLSFTLSGAAPYIPVTGEVLKNVCISPSGKYPSATVVYVALEKADGRVRRVGIKFDVLRKPYSFHRVEFVKTPAPSIHIASRQQGPIDQVINVVRYYNDRHEEIVAIVNSTAELGERTAMPVVIIPPALGRRKETLGLLALMILETFRAQGKHVAVVRYDGVRTVGESYNDRECRFPGREMLNFTMSQSVEDLLTTLHFLETHDRIECTDVVVLAFSMVSIIARKAIIRDARKRVGLCISVMGSTDVEDFLFNATGGLDCLRDYQAGLKDGTFEVLGCLMRRAMLGDILDHDLAYLQSARQDMATIDIPMAWIYGLYDYWTNQKRVEDIMSVLSPSTRVLYEVPTGHILKTSDEAMQVFDLAVRIMWLNLFQALIKPVWPDPDKAKNLNAAEWERVKRPTLNSKTYWKQYLLDKQEGRVGYDVLAFANDYSDFLEAQLDLLRLREGDTIADIGGGTGTFLSFYLGKIFDPRQCTTRQPVKSFVALDLVWEALCRAKAKFRAFSRMAGGLSMGVSFVAADTDLEGQKIAIPCKDASFTRILASLLISYLRNPQGLVNECHRLLQPDGLLVISSLKPDADMSKPVTDLIGKIKQAGPLIDGVSKAEFLASAQSFMNLAASLFDLEEEKIFKFYTPPEIRDLLQQAGFREIEICESFGDPPQALIAVGRKSA